MQTLLKTVKEVKQDGGNNSLVDDEIAKIRHEFNAAKQSFLKIPEALKKMPKMNPEGTLVLSYALAKSETIKCTLELMLLLLLLSGAFVFC